MNSASSPIGIFDSGIGGLTVAKAVMQAMPNEDIIYFGDTARVPYGIKSEETVRKYALEITRFLISKKVKMILIACNTVSASAKDEIIHEAKGIPVLDVITAGTQAALQNKGITKLGVIGTMATINSEAYAEAVRERDDQIKVIQRACPLLVPLAEEGWIDNDIARQTLHVYLSPFKNEGIQSLILGCTHYPLFKDIIPEILGKPEIEIVDSGVSIAIMANNELSKKELLNKDGGDFLCYVTDRPQRFKQLAEQFLGRPLQEPEIIRL